MPNATITPIASAKLASLRKPLLDFPPDEALAFVQALRTRRKRPQAPLKATSRARKEKVDAVAK